MTVQERKRRAVILAVTYFGLLVLMIFGAGYGELSPREWVIGVVACTFALIVALRMIRRSQGPSKAEPNLDEATRKGISRRIRRNKVLVVSLAAVFPIGVIDGVSQRAWLPTLAGAGVSVFLMLVAARDIRRDRKSLSRQ